MKKTVANEVYGWVAAAVLVAGTLTLLIGCGSENSNQSNESGQIDLSEVEIDPDDPVTIEYWHYFTDDRGAPAIREWIEEFEEENPGMKVEERYNESPQLTSNVQAAVAAGTPPDLTVSTEKRYLVEELGAIPMDRFEVEEGFWDDYYPNVREFGQVDGRQVSVPYAFSTSLFYYNADLFRETGLDPNEPPETWQEVREYSRQIKNETSAYGYYPLLYLGWPIQAPAITAGAELVNEQGEAAFATPESIEVTQLMIDMAQEDETIPNATREELDQSFLSGEIAMYLGTSATINSFRESAQFDLRTAIVPAWEDKPLRAPNGGSNLMIMTDDPEKQKVAWEWIEFISTPERLTEWTEVTGYLPPKEGLLEDPEYLGPFVESDPLFRGAVDMLPYTIQPTEWPGTNGQEIESNFEDTWDGVMTGEVTDAEAALTELENETNKLLPR